MALLQRTIFITLNIFYMMRVDNYIMDRNKLIAEFMGIKTINKADFEKSGGSYNVDEYSILEYQRYHREWNWLMPVVEKIETTEYTLPEKYKRGSLKNDIIYYVEIGTLYDQREEFKGWEGIVSFVHGTTISNPGIRFKTKIEAMYNGVVEFITWYNEQNNLS